MENDAENFAFSIKLVENDNFASWFNDALKLLKNMVRLGGNAQDICCNAAVKIIFRIGI